MITGVIPFDTTGLPPGATFGAVNDTGEAGPRSERIDAGPLKVGQSFGPRYHIIKLLGVGGMGAVYQAWDSELSVAVALKVIRGRKRASADQEKRFKTELLLARSVTHKNVVRIHDLGEIDGTKYITMSYVQGADLATLLRTNGKFPIARALPIARQIAAGLEAAHEAGVVHRDLKPANVMIGADDLALIMDFGISASNEDAAAGGIVGTLEYMAPEQGIGQTVDGRADIYAFGLIFYELLSGPRTSKATTAQERIAAMRARTMQGLAPLHTIEPAVPEPLAAIIDRCLTVKPTDRFQTTSELRTALSALDEAGELIPIPPRFTKKMISAAALVLVMLIAATYATTRRLVTPAKAHDPVSVLIADFDNQSGDATFDDTLEETLAIALENASFITVFKQGEAHAVAEQLGRGSRITPEVGQVIAYSRGIKVLVAGGIEKAGSGYTLHLRTIDPANAKTLTSVTQQVAGAPQALKAVTAAAVKIRQSLGESRTEMTKIAAAETATTGSLDAMRAYARGQQMQEANKYREALQEYEHAVALDPQFGRAYAGIAGIYANYFKDPQRAEANYQAALKNLDRMTDREKYRTLGTYYVDIAQNYEKAIENYETLVRLYPADDGGHGNLALAYLLTGNLPHALTEVRKSLDIYPRNYLQRYNYAMYSMYAGDFAASVNEATRVTHENPTFEYGWLPIALARVAQGDIAGARAAYDQLAAMSPVGASFASLGRGDLALYEGNPSEAVRILTAGLGADQSRGNTAQSARKYAALADAYLALGDKPKAVAAATQSVALSQRESTAFPAALTLIAAGRDPAAGKIATTLENTLQRQTSAYGRIIEAELKLDAGQVADAIEGLRDAQKRHDSWFNRYLLGRAYVVAGHYPEALAELELCVKRRGEAMDVFFYDLPTARVLPPLYYWLGRAQQGVGLNDEAKKSFAEFVRLHGPASHDPLAADAERRINGH